jgi:hypothetical protein
MTYTAHIEDPDQFGYRELNIYRDGEHVKRIGVVRGDDHGALADAADPMLRGDGWRPEDGGAVFWWGAPDGNMFDGPWRAAVERT